MKLYSSQSQKSHLMKLPELKNHQKFLITEPDDRGFCQEQVDKINQDIYLQNQLKLKPWEKDSYKNIYNSSGKSNHQILKNIKYKVNSCKTIDIDDLTNNKFYKNYQIRTICDSQEISKNVMTNSKIRSKYKQPLTDLKTYTNQTKQICFNNMLTHLIKIEREKMKAKQTEYDKALKYEMNDLKKDIHKFEAFTTNEIIIRNQKNKDFNIIKSHMKILTEAIKVLSQEYHSTKVDVQRMLKKINDKKIYVNFVHKLLGGEPELKNCNLEDLNFQNLNDKELNLITNRIDWEMQNYNPENNVLDTSPEDESLGSSKIDIIFKIMEDNIMKTLDEKEKSRNELESLIENWEKEKKEIDKIIEEREEEYETLYNEYLREKENVELITFSSGGYNCYIRKLHVELFEYINNVIIKNKNDIDEYNVVDKIIKPNIDEIKKKELKIDDLIREMEKYSKENSKLFDSTVNKVKNENKILKYLEEKNIREIANSMRNAKILEKMNKIMITGRYKYKMPVPLSILKQKTDNKKELKTEPSDLQYIQY
jgi:hypothetical protein